MIFSCLGEGTTFDMNPNNEGTWGLVCRVNDHFNAGMKVTYTVNSCGSSASDKTSGTKRKFYIGIIEREWDYAETNKSLVHGFELDKNSRLTVFFNLTGTNTDLPSHFLLQT